MQSFIQLFKEEENAPKFIMLVINAMHLDVTPHNFGNKFQQIILNFPQNDWPLPKILHLFRNDFNAKKRIHFIQM